MPLNFTQRSQPQAAPTPAPAPAQPANAAPRVGGGLPLRSRPMAAQPMRPQAPVQPRSLFTGIEAVAPSFATNYLREGTYYALIRGCKSGENRKRIGMFIVEMTCVGSLNPHTQHPHVMGEEMSHIMMADKDAFLPNVKAFIAAAMDGEADEVTVSVCDEVTGETQPIAGVLIEVEAQQIITKANNPFTRVNYKRVVSATEVASLEEMTEEIADRIFGPGVLQNAVAAEQGAG